MSFGIWELGIIMVIVALLSFGRPTKGFTPYLSFRPTL